MFVAMEKAFNEIGKLRSEMRVGFIEMENQLQATRDTLNVNLGKVIDTTQKMGKHVEQGFIAIEEAMDEDFTRLEKEITQIKDRLDKANL